MSVHTTISILLSKANTLANTLISTQCFDVRTPLVLFFVSMKVKSLRSKCHQTVKQPDDLYTILDQTDAICQTVSPHLECFYDNQSSERHHLQRNYLIIVNTHKIPVTNKLIPIKGKCVCLFTLLCCSIG